MQCDIITYRLQGLCGYYRPPVGGTWPIRLKVACMAALERSPTDSRPAPWGAIPAFGGPEQQRAEIASGEGEAVIRPMAPPAPSTPERRRVCPFPGTGPFPFRLTSVVPGGATVRRLVPRIGLWAAMVTRQSSQLAEVDR
jgi:hypothetical protein